MGQLYFRNQIIELWFGLDDYFEITFHYDFGRYANPKDYDYYLDVEKWPELRRWIRDDCEGDVIVKSPVSNDYGRKWIDLYFEYETDLMAFKLKWL